MTKQRMLSGAVVGRKMRKVMIDAMHGIEAALKRSGRPNGIPSAYDVFVKDLPKLIPGAGIVSGWDDLNRDGTMPDSDVWFAANPLEGDDPRAPSKRMQRIGPTLALVQDGEVIASYIGDMQTGTLIGYAPGSSTVQIKVIGTGASIPLALPSLSAQQKMFLLTDLIEAYSSTTHKLVSINETDLTRALQMDGALSIVASQVWRGGASGLVLRRGEYPPWQILPLIGISEKLKINAYPVSAFAQLAYAARAFSVTCDTQTVVEDVALVPEVMFDHIARNIHPDAMPDALI